MTRLLTATILLLVLQGCACIGPHRKYVDVICDEATDTHCDDVSMIKSKNGYYLSFVEMDDQGLFLDRRQASAITQFLEGKKNLYVIVYVHGWHNSAARGNGNVQSFRERLRFTQERYPGKQVVGVYIGWRGESVTLPGLNALTFWERKNVSEEIGKNQLLALLLQIESIKTKTSDNRNVLLLVGHSFGGSVLYNAVHQTLMQRLIQSDGAHVRGFGDLVVLVNPAMESMRYAPLADESAIHARERGFSATQPTLLMVVATVSDTPVRTMFPLGRWLSTLFESHRVYGAPRHYTEAETLLNQVEMDRSAVGHFEPHVTHKLDANRSSGKDYSCPYRPGWKEKAIEHRKMRQRALGEIETGEGWDTHNRAMGPESPAFIGDPADMQIRHLNRRSHVFSPYWIISTDASTFPGHSPITQKHFWCFVDVVIQEATGPFLSPMVERTEVDTVPKD